MERNIRNEVAALRRAVEAAGHENNWETRQVLLENALRKLPVSDVQDLVLSCLKIYLPRFKSVNPQSLWAVECIAQANKILSGDGESEELPTFPHWNTKLADPMSRTFRSAIGSFWGMARCKSKPKCFAEHATSAIVKTITILDTEYAVKHWTPSEYPAKSEIEYRDYLNKLWTDLVGKLERFTTQNGTVSNENS